MNFTIDIKGAPQGASNYDFHVYGSFFQAYDNDRIKDADLDLAISLNKSHEWIKAVCNIKGTVVVECDRCLDDLSLPIDISTIFTIKFSSVADEDYGDEVVVLDRNDAELDLSQIVYDYVCLSLPIQAVHPEGECNPAIMERMKSILLK